MSSRAKAMASPVHRPVTISQGLSRLPAPAGLQTKLSVGPANDRYEQEADRAADRVLKMGAFGTPASASPPPPLGQGGAGTVQRACACGATAGGDGECEECAKARLQRKAADGKDSAAAPPKVNDVLRSSGHPLDARTRAFMEPRFGHDFGRVRVHTDERAASSARGVNALAYTAGEHVVFGDGQFRPGTDAGRRLLAHELAHVIQQSSGSVPDSQWFIQRQACPHDGKGTGCGAGAGKIKFPGETLHLDKTVVEHGLIDFGGKWLTEVQSPPNPAKPDEPEDRGRIDGVRVTENGSLKVEVAEVKPRSPGSLLSTKITGGCAQASREARGYVDELQKIAPKIMTLSEKFAKIGGFRMMDHHTPKTKAEEGIFKAVDVNIDNEDWFNAWKFYNSVQNKWPKVFTRAFTSVDVVLFSEGDQGKTYRALGWPIKCENGEDGKQELFYMVNTEGGVSYGCESTCKEAKPDKDPEPKDDKEAQKKKKEAEAAAAKAAKLKELLLKILDAKETLANSLSAEEGDHATQRDIIYKPSAIGFVGFWTNVLFNKEPPMLSIWDEVHVLLDRVDVALKARNPAAAIGNLISARRAYIIAFKKFHQWKDGIEEAAGKMQIAIGVVAVAIIVTFVTPEVADLLAEAAATAGETATAAPVAELLETADAATTAVEANAEAVEAAMQAEQELAESLQTAKTMVAP